MQTPRPQGYRLVVVSHESLQEKVRGRLRGQAHYVYPVELPARTLGLLVKAHRLSHGTTVVVPHGAPLNWVTNAREVWFE